MLSVAVGESVLAGGAGARRRRQHGFQLPLHPLQLSGWLTLAILSGGSFLVLIPALPLYVQPTALAVLSVLLLLHLAAHVASAFIDPAEEALRERKPEPVPKLDRSKHAHVIESGHCHLCLITTSSARTKHCSSCNKCVRAFDHHCKWLNHCVGSRNYAAFLMCVSTAVAAAAVVAALAVAQLVLHHHASWRWHQETEDPPVAAGNSTVPPPPSGDAAFLAVVAALGLLAAVTAGLLVHLCFFHVYISFLGLTTYEYIRNQRQNQVPTTSPDGVEVRASDGATSRHRPVSFLRGGAGGRTRTTLFTCSVAEEETLVTCNAEPTPTPPSTPQDCQGCVGNNSVAPEVGAPHKRARRRWNCCVSVPDSPDDPHSPTEPKCLMSLCRHKVKNKNTPAIDGRPHRTHGHWSSAKLRVIFRVLGNLGQTKRRPSHPGNRPNQVAPNEQPPPAPIQTINNLVPVPCYPDVPRRANALPALSAPPRRRLVSEAELANALSVLQQQQQRCASKRAVYRRRKRTVVHRQKTPALSPIRESGFSNPASPSRQGGAAPAIGGVAI